MLCVIPPNVIPSRDKLMASAINNPHGFGFAIAIPNENRILVEKSMNPDESINRFLEMRGHYPEGFAMWHARLATHGSTTIDNCHPFQVDDVGLTYLGHNGILPVLEDKTDRSDTRIFAEDVLPAMGGVTALDNEQLYNMIEDFTSGSKVCVITLDPKAEYQCYLIHKEKGTTDESGVWWSNNSCSWDYGRSYTKSHKPYSYAWDYDYDAYRTTSKKNEDDIVEVMECPACGGVLDTDAEAEGICEYCETCFDCASHYTDCMCYYPSSNSKYGKWLMKDPEPTAVDQPFGPLKGLEY